MGEEAAAAAQVPEVVVVVGLAEVVAVEAVVVRQKWAWLWVVSASSEELGEALPVLA